MTIESANDDAKISSKYCQNIVTLLPLYRQNIVIILSNYRQLTIIIHAIVKILPKYHPLAVILAQVTIESANDNIETRDPFRSFFSNHFRLDAERDKRLQKQFVTNS